MKEGLDWIARGIVNAVEDVRERVVIEPWFGRQPPEPSARPDPFGDTAREDDEDSLERWWNSADAKEFLQPYTPVAELEGPVGDPTHTHKHHR